MDQRTSSATNAETGSSSLPGMAMVSGFVSDACIVGNSFGRNPASRCANSVKHNGNGLFLALIGNDFLLNHRVHGRCKKFTQKSCKKY
jgi:hypothetical protein